MQSPSTQIKLGLVALILWNSGMHTNVHRGECSVPADVPKPKIQSDSRIQRITIKQSSRVCIGRSSITQNYELSDNFYRSSEYEYFGRMGTRIDGPLLKKYPAALSSPLIDALVWAAKDSLGSTSFWMKENGLTSESRELRDKVLHSKDTVNRNSWMSISDCEVDILPEDAKRPGNLGVMGSFFAGSDFCVELKGNENIKISGTGRLPLEVTIGSRTWETYSTTLNCLVQKVVEQSGLRSHDFRKESLWNEKLEEYWHSVERKAIGRSVEKVFQAEFDGWNDFRFEKLYFSELEHKVIIRAVAAKPMTAVIDRMNLKIAFQNSKLEEIRSALTNVYQTHRVCAEAISGMSKWKNASPDRSIVMKWSFAPNELFARNAKDPASPAYLPEEPWRNSIRASWQKAGLALEPISCFVLESNRVPKVVVCSNPFVEKVLWFKVGDRPSSHSDFLDLYPEENEIEVTERIKFSDILKDIDAF